MNKKKKVVIIIVAFVSIGVIAGLFFYDYSIHGNVVTAWAGTLSAFATVAIGAIAFIQNRNQQKRADEQSDLALMPDIYISNSPLERYSSVTHALFNTVKAALKDKTISTKNVSIDFWFIRGPIVNVSLVELKFGKQSFEFDVEEKRTFRMEEIPFRLLFNVPKGAINENEYLLVIEYENVYSTKYQKNIRFKYDDAFSKTIVIELERAHRI